MDEKNLVNLNPKIIREETGVKVTTTKNGVTREIRNVGEIHMVLKDKTGKIKEDRLTKDKQRSVKNV